MIFNKEVLGIANRRVREAPSRRKIYYAEYIPSSMPPPMAPPLTLLNNRTTQPQQLAKQKEERQLASGMERFDSLLKGIIDDINAVPTPKPVMTEPLVTRLPAKVCSVLQNTSDSQLKLKTLLAFEPTLRIKPEYVDYVLIAEMGLENARDLYESLSEDKVLKLVEYYVHHKEFGKVAKIINQAVYVDYHRDVSVLGFAVINTLKQDYDLEFGLMEILSEIYSLVLGDYKMFKFHFNILTEKGRISGLPQALLDVESVFGTIQLDSMISKAKDVNELPLPIWKTGDDYVNLRLGLKCFEQNLLERGFAVLKKEGVIGKDGVIYRLFKSGEHLPTSKNLSKPTAFEKKFFRAIIHNEERNISDMDVEKLRSGTKNMNIFNNLLVRLESNKNKHKLRNAYLKKLLDMNDVKSGMNLIMRNLQSAQYFDIPYLVKVFSITKHSESLSELAQSLPLSVRSPFISQLMQKCIPQGPSKESRVPELQYSSIEWILEGIQYRLTDENFREISKVLHKLPFDMQKDIITKISGVSCSNYFGYLSRGVPLSYMLIPTLVCTRKINGRNEMIGMGKYIARNFSQREIISILEDLSDEPTLQEELHFRVLQSLLKNEKYDMCKEMFKSLPNPRLQFVMNEHLVMNGEKPIIYSCYKDHKIDLVKLKTIERLLDDTKLGFSSTLRNNTKELIKHKKFTKEMALLMLKKIVKKIVCNGDLKVTERLQWAVELCVKYGVPKDEISQLIKVNKMPFFE